MNALKLFVLSLILISSSLLYAPRPSGDEVAIRGCRSGQCQTVRVRKRPVRRAIGKAVSAPVRWVFRGRRCRSRCG